MCLDRVTPITSFVWAQQSVGIVDSPILMISHSFSNKCFCKWFGSCSNDPSVTFRFSFLPSHSMILLILPFYPSHNLSESGKQTDTRFYLLTWLFLTCYKIASIPCITRYKIIFYSKRLSRYDSVSVHTIRIWSFRHIDILVQKCFHYWITWSKSCVVKRKSAERGVSFVRFQHIGISAISGLMSGMFTTARSPQQCEGSTTMRGVHNNARSPQQCEESTTMRGVHSNARSPQQCEGSTTMRGVHNNARGPQQCEGSTTMRGVHNNARSPQQCEESTTMRGVHNNARGPQQCETRN